MTGAVGRRRRDRGIPSHTGPFSPETAGGVGDRRGGAVGSPAGDPGVRGGAAPDRPPRALPSTTPFSLCYASSRLLRTFFSYSGG